MNLFYNGFAIHEIGEVTISQAREYEDGQRARVTLKVGVSLFERSYGDNYALVKQFKDAIRTQNAVLQWANEDTLSDYVNQTARIQSDDLPDEWGTYQMQFNVVFVFYEQDVVTNNMLLTYTGGTAPVSLGFVSRWSETVTTERPSTYNSERTLVKLHVSAAGYFSSDTSLSLAERRMDLTNQKAAMTAAFTQTKEGQFIFGQPVKQFRGEFDGGASYLAGQWFTYQKVGYIVVDDFSGGVFTDLLAAGHITALLGPAGFNSLMRIEEFTVDLDQAREAVNWTLKGSMTLLPDETVASITEYQVETRETFNGQQFLTITGKIIAKTEAIARDQMAQWVALNVEAYGYNTKSQILRSEAKASTTTAPELDAALTFTQLDFVVEYRRWRSDNFQATFTDTKTNKSVSLGNVNSWELDYSARRFSDLHSQRQRAGGTINATGTWTGDLGASLADQRAAMLKFQRDALAAVNGADGTLTYGDFTQVVRVDNLKATINQALTGIDWNLSASYSLFPNESGYATVDFTVAQTSNAEDGEETMTLSGTILAPDETLARAKLNLIRDTALGTYGYNIAQQLRPQSTVRSVSANGDQTKDMAEHEAADGTVFIELTFSEEYRRRRATLVSFTLQSSSRSDITSGLIQTSYSGSVVVGGPIDAAYTIALAKAASLGANQAAAIGGNAWLRSSQINWDQRQVQAENNREFIRLNFAYEYQSKIPLGSAYIEMSTDRTVDTFGTDATAVSGVVVAVDAATALALYNAQIRNAYNGSIIQGERTAQARVMVQNSSGFTVQETRLEFSFSVFVPKATGTINQRYGVSVSNDYLQLSRLTRIRGSVYAATEAAASAAVTALLATIGGGNLLRDERQTDHEYTSASGQDAFLKYDFEFEYADRITGVAGVLEVRVSESIRYSGVRWIPQPIPRDANGTGGVTIVQDGGIAEGSRQVRGSVTAATLATAQTWARKQRSLLTGDNNRNSFPLPEEMENDYEWVPRTDGVISGVGSNVRLYRVNFTFAEILPNFPPPA